MTRSGTITEQSSECKLVEVWCDVGGTFTDCFVVFPDGKRLRRKVLSHGRVPSFVRDSFEEFRWRDRTKCEDPDRFWEGCIGKAFDRQMNLLGAVRCIGFTSGTGEFQAVRLDREFSDGLAVDLHKGTCWDSPELLSRDFTWAQVDSIEWDPRMEAPVLAARLMLGVRLDESLPALEVRLGTTRATNALLTRNGEPTALVVTQGFEDLLAIGYQERPELFVTRVIKRPSLVSKVVGITERLDASGNVLRELDEAQVRRALGGIAAEGIRSLAICLLHATRNAAHEERVERIAIEMGFSSVRCSHRVAPVNQAVARGETTVVDAYLTPVVRRYLEMVSEQFSSGARSRLRVMTSSGGLVSAQDAWGRQLVLSGPAGGAVALQAIADRIGVKRLIGLDMGGTSTDVCRIDGRLQLEHETVKAGIRMMVPTLAIHTVAAGGGSICGFDGEQLRVGPQSAGSAPGPACYGRGGPLTLTDLNLLEGRIDPIGFPFELEIQASRDRLAELLERVRANAMFASMEPMQLVAGLRRIANEQMAAAVRSISIEQGADPRDHVLAGFGGAAGQHLCQIAELLEMDTIIDHPDAGLLSALGIGVAQISRSQTHAFYKAFEAVSREELLATRQVLYESLAKQMQAEGVAASDHAIYCDIELRVSGTEGSIRIPWGEGQVRGWSAEFEVRYRERYGVDRSGGMLADRPLELVGMWLEISSPMRSIVEGETQKQVNVLEVVESDLRNVQVFDQGAWTFAPSVDRATMQSGDRFVGPTLIRSVGSTTMIDRGWEGEVGQDGVLFIRRRSEQASVESKEIRLRLTESGLKHPGSLGASFTIDPILREVIAQRVAAIAQQMGIVLEQTALSVNVKQRRDFSCAVFNSRGELIANAPHVPVHLGAMGRTVQSMMEAFPQMVPGDCFVTNDPYRGGSHLPDVTVVTPGFVEDIGGVRGVEGKNDRVGESKPAFFVASRAHHAEIGGIAPGSMAPTSRRLGEEGVIIPPMRLAAGGADRSREVEALLRGGEYPTRNVAENMADLWAQRAANHRGVIAMQELAQAFGAESLQEYFGAILDVAESKTRNWIASLSHDEYRFEDGMDDGSAIKVLMRRVLGEQGWTFVVDFTGSGVESIGNLNANPGIVTAAVMYTIRCAIADSMPLNYGVMRAVELRIPKGILDPRGIGPMEQWPAVAGGNVETSQRIVDVLWGALGLAAASQGTMNNFLFGNTKFGYYETIGGGSGASAQGGGADAVHSHMTNTRLTDVEVLESRYPVRVVNFGIRLGSGGDGKYVGGCGMIREIEALERLEVSLVTNRRWRVDGKFAGPYGLDGGGAGQPGENWWIDREGNSHRLPSSVQQSIEVGERIRILTPGGGGWGIPQNNTIAKNLPDK